MKVAILHDYLNQFGGAERVLKSILDLFPDADVYTLLYDKEKTQGIFEGKIKGTSFLDYDWIRRNHRAFIPLMPFAARTIRSKKQYDLIISSTIGYAKGFPISAPYHISYCHSPLRYAWEIDYLKNLSFTPRPMTKDALRPVADWLKRWDKKASKRVNFFIANSHFIAEKIRAYYNRDAEVVYPPVDTDIFFFDPKQHIHEEFYLMAGRLIYYKGFDTGIQAFNRIKKRLVIIGRGPEEKKLRALANPTYVKFIPWVSDNDLRAYYNAARAFIFPQIEDFGLVAAEAQACGLPVLSFCKGGGGEIVIPGKTGLLFGEQTPDAIIDAVKEFEMRSFDRRKIYETGKRFSDERFKKEFVGAIKKSGFLNGY
jgi:glycosyltransferase involved in cell wall biosynthesis